MSGAAFWLKQLSQVRRIRSNRLQRQEILCQKQRRVLERANQALDHAVDEKQVIEGQVQEQLLQLREQHLNQSTSITGLLDWSEKDQQQQQRRIDAKYEHQKACDTLEEEKDNMQQAKKQYQRLLTSIEKLDIFCEQLSCQGDRY